MCYDMIKSEMIILGWFQGGGGRTLVSLMCAKSRTNKLLLSGLFGAHSIKQI